MGLVVMVSMMVSASDAICVINESFDGALTEMTPERSMTPVAGSTGAFSVSSLITEKIDEAEEDEDDRQQDASRHLQDSARQRGKTKKQSEIQIVMEGRRFINKKNIP